MTDIYKKQVHTNSQYNLSSVFKDGYVVISPNVFAELQNFFEINYNCIIAM